MTLRRRSMLRPAVAGLCVLAIASAAPALAAPSTSAVRAQPSATAPWRSAGLGWAVAEYSASIWVQGFPSKDKPGPTTLYLTSPTGHKYLFHTWPATDPNPPTLLDWSGDRQRALLIGYGAKAVRLVQVSLATGKVLTSVTMPSDVTPLGYTRPDGLNVLALRNPTTTSEQVVRYNLTGHLQAVVGTVASAGARGAIDSPDGTSVIAGTARGLTRFKNTGGVLSVLRAPTGVQDCAPVRWWSTSTVLATCGSTNPSYVNRLWLFSFGARKVTALTPQRGNKGPDLGDLAAWKLTSGLYLQAAGACGTEFVARQNSTGAVHTVNIPGTAGNNQIVTGYGARLLVHAIGGCPGGGSLLWFDPATSVVHYVLHPGTGVVGVRAAVPYGRPVTS